MNLRTRLPSPLCSFPSQYAGATAITTTIQPFPIPGSSHDHINIVSGWDHREGINVNIMLMGFLFRLWMYMHGVVSINYVTDCVTSCMHTQFWKIFCMLRTRIFFCGSYLLLVSVTTYMHVHYLCRFVVVLFAIYCWGILSGQHLKCGVNCAPT